MNLGQQECLRQTDQDGEIDFQKGFEIMAQHSSPNVHTIEIIPPWFTVAFCRENYFRVSEAAESTSLICCSNCTERKENWVCLSCYKPFCSRYKNGHSGSHFSETNHAIHVSTLDLSIWDHDQNVYLDVFNIRELHPAFKILHEAKFNIVAALPDDSTDQSGSVLELEFVVDEDLDVKKPPPPTPTPEP